MGDQVQPHMLILDCTHPHRHNPTYVAVWLEHERATQMMTRVQRETDSFSVQQTSV